jgi:hypothetical protein
MKKYILILTAFLLFSCSEKVNPSQLNLLNGYWQITKAVNANGDKKEYKINEIYDYFEIKRTIGFHKKVTWQPTGTFLVNDAQDTVSIKISGETVYLNFSTPFGKHKEELVYLSEQQMILLSDIGTKFYYEKVVLNKKE